MKKFLAVIIPLTFILIFVSCTKKNMHPAVDLGTDTGTAWKAVGGESVSAGDSWYSSLYVYNGVPYVAYKDFTVSGKLSIKKYESGSWQYVGAQGFSPGDVAFPAVSVYNGTPYVMYVDVAANSSIAVKRLVSGSWQNVGAAYVTNTACYAPSFFINSAGTPYVAYSNITSGYLANVMYYNGTSWTALGAEDFSPNSAEYTSLYVDGTTPYVAFKDYGAAQKASVMKYNGSAWVNVGTAGFSSGVVYSNSLIPVFVDAGVPYVAYTDQTLGKVQLMKYNSGTLAWDKQGGTGINASPGLALFVSLYVKSGTPYLAYWDNVAGGKVMVVKYNGTAFEVVGAPDFSYGSAANPCVFVDSSNTPWVSYVDAGLLSKVVVKKYY